METVLGTMYYGTRTDEATSMRLLDRFVERGGTWIDTANAYAFWSDPSGVGGQSERLVGRWLARRPGLRDRVRISTKMRYQPVAPGDWPASAEGMSAKAVRGAVTLSLQRLGIEAVDLYWAHGEDRDVPLDESVAAFADLVDEGLVRRLGASNHATWSLERARVVAGRRPRFTAVQLRWSYVRPRPGAALPDSGHLYADEQALDYVRSNPDLVLWGYTPLVNGAFVRADRPLPEAYDHPGTARRLAVLGEVADELGATRNQVVLAWMRGGDPAVLPIVGASTLAQLDEALDEVVLTPAQRERLDAAV